MLSEELEQALREKFSGLEARAKVPASIEARLAQRDYHPRAGYRGLATAAAASAAVVATSVAVPLALHSDGRTATTLRLASYSLRLPGRYHDVISGSVLCNPLALFAFAPHPGVTPPGPNSQPAEPGIASAADQAGACVSIGMSAAFTPGSPDQIWVATKPSVTQPVDIDGYQGWVGTWTWQGAGLNGGDMLINGVPTPNGSTEEVLALTVPESDGQLQYFAVAATGVNAAQLVSIVSSGVTLPAPAATTSTTAGLPAATVTTTLP
jgi:hypothetical protein